MQSMLLNAPRSLLLLRTAVRMLALPTRKFDSYPAVSVVCMRCEELLFRYRKKNGTKSSLAKCYIERVVEDPHGLLVRHSDGGEVACPQCLSRFARGARIHGRAALKMVGGKVRMKR